MSADEYKIRVQNLITGVALCFLMGDDDMKTNLLRYEYVLKMIPVVCHYIETGIMESIIDPIYLGKLAYIADTKTKKDFEQIITPPKLHSNGNNLICDGPYHIPQEELILWSQISLVAPPSDIGFRRYAEVFKTVFGFSIEDIENGGSLAGKQGNAA